LFLDHTKDLLFWNKLGHCLNLIKNVWSLSLYFSMILLIMWKITSFSYILHFAQLIDNKTKVYCNHQTILCYILSTLNIYILVVRISIKLIVLTYILQTDDKIENVWNLAMKNLRWFNQLNKYSTGFTEFLTYYCFPSRIPTHWVSRQKRNIQAISWKLNKSVDPFYYAAF
jgi:hypothetical protein